MSFATGVKICVTQLNSVWLGSLVVAIQTVRIDLLIFKVGWGGKPSVNVKGTSAAILVQMFTEYQWVPWRRVG